MTRYNVRVVMNIEGDPSDIYRDFIYDSADDVVNPDFNQVVESMEDTLQESLKEIF